MEYNKEYAKKVYAGLTKRGYTADMLGDEAKFVERMANEDNRKYLYDQVQKRGDAKMGSWEHFNSRMMEVAPQTVTAPQVETEPLGKAYAQAADVVKAVPQLGADKNAYTFTAEELGIEEEQQLNVPSLVQMREKIKAEHPYLFPVEKDFKVTDKFYDAKAPVEMRKQISMARENFAGMDRVNQEKVLQAMFSGASIDDVVNKYLEDTNRTHWPGEEEIAKNDLTRVFKWATGGDSVDPDDENVENWGDEYIRSFKGYSPNEIKMGLAPEEVTKAYQEKLVTETEVKRLQAELERLIELRDVARHNRNEAEKSARTNIGAYSFGTGGYTMNQVAGATKLDAGKWAAAEREYDDAIRAIERKLSGEDVGFWEGVVDAIGDPNVLTLGLSGLQDARAMLSLSREGVNSAENEALADALYSNQEAQKLHDYGFWYKAGSGLIQSVPFMVEMFSTGSMGGASQVGTKLASKMAKNAAEKSVKKKVAKAVGATIDDMIEAGLVANTAGAGQTYADIAKRAAGKITKDENGDYKFINRDGWIGAALKGEFSSIFSFYTEKLGNHLEGKMSVTKGLENIGASKLSRGLLAVKNSDLMQNVNKAFKLAGVNGVWSEIGEEEVDYLLNAIFIGDNEFSKLFDLETQMDIVGGTAITIGSMRAIPGTIASVGYVNNKRLLNKSDRKAEELYGEKWSSIREKIENASNENIAKVVSEEFAVSGEEQQKALLDFYKRTMVMRGYNIGTMKRENTNPMAEKAFMDGYENTDPATANGNTIALANKALDDARAGVRAALNLGEDADVDAVIAGKEFEGEAKAAVDTYLADKAKVEGMRDRFNEQRDSEIAEADKSVDAVMHEDGNVYMTTLPSTGEAIFITGGKVVLDNEGYIDVNQSEGLVALMPNGKKEAIQPGNIREKVSVESAEVQKAAKSAEIDNRYKSQLNTFVYSDGMGDHTVQLIGRRGNLVDVIVDGRQMEMGAQEYDNIMAEVTGNGKVEGENEVQPVVAPVVEGQKGENIVESSPTGEVAAPVVEAPKTALEQIPKNEKNVPLYEQVDSELAWDGVVEEAGGNEETAMVAVNSMVEDKKKALAAAEKAKAKAGVTITEKIAAENERVANIEKAKADLAKWQEIAGVKAKRAVAQAENVAQPTVETAPVVESAPVEDNTPQSQSDSSPTLVEQPTPQATNEMQEAELAPAAEPAGNSEQLSSSEFPNYQSVAEGGNAPGNGGVVDNNSANALQNGNNELNLQKENESDNESNQNDIPVGGQVSQSVSQGEHGEVASLSGGVQETATRLRERIESAQRDPKSGLREVENRVAREFAQENGLWIENEFKLGVPFPSGDEHNNYIDAENQVIYKVNNRMHTPSILGLLDRMELHNKYFPNTQYRLVGFTSVSENGDVMPVFAQDFVLNAHMATVDEIDSYMGTLGFTRVGDGRYSNGEVVIKDLKPRNVLVNPNGDAFVVDAEFEQENTQKIDEIAESTPEIQEPRSVEEVLENGDKRITNYNSRGEVATVVTERDGKVVSVDSYDEGVLFEHTEYDGGGKAASVTRYDKSGNAIGTQAYVDGKAVPSETAEQPETGDVANAGPVNMETLQLNMSEEDFNALLNSGDKAAISEYLAEMDGLLRIGVGSPLDGQEALREEYRKAVERYGKENIPTEVMDDLNSRMQPYSDLSRAIFDRKYALQDKLREIEASEAQAKEQAEKEAKAERKKTAFGGFLAGKTDVGASTAEKALSKKYNFDGKVMTVAEFVEDAVGNGNVKLSAIEEPKYKGASRAAWNRMDARQQEADAKRVKESGTKTVYTVNDHDLGKTAYDYARFLLDKKAEQEKADAKKAVENVIKPFAKEKREETKPATEKIEDVGEKIGGARKDIIRQYADKIKLDGKTFSTMFPKPDVDKLVEAGLPKDKVAAVKAMYDNAKREFEMVKKRRGKDKALQASLFYAMYAKNVLTGEEGNFDLAYNGFAFTEWGKEFMKANIALYKAVFNKLGTDYGKVDLRSYFITPLAAGMREYFNLKKLNEENSRMQQRMAEMDGRKVPEYKDGDVINFVGEHYSRPSNQFETLEEAVNTMVERISKEVKVDEAAQYKVESYWKRDAQGRADYTKAYLGIKVRGFGTVDVMEFKNMNEARAWLQDHREDFQQMAAAKEEQVKAENKKPLPKYVLGHSYNEAQSQYSVFADFGKEGVKILKTFNIPQAEGVAAQAKARSEVYKNDVLPYMNSEEALSLANGFAQEIRDAKSAKQKPVTVEKKSRERVGVDWRNGKNATPDMFVDIEGNKPSVFGFRAVEFGNYVTQKERQQYLNDIYDALMDMSEVLGVSPRALSLGGKLALAVGARGTSGASGHYEPYKNVINITKTKGAGVLAHEWLHALDRYFSNFDENALYPNGVRYATGKEYAENTRQEIKDAFEKIMSAVRGGEYQKRSARLGDYWASDKELAARALQDYMMRKLDERGQKNDFLSNHLAPEDWAGDMNNYPFPLGAEADRIAEAFDNFFATVEEKTEDGQTVLFQQGMIELDHENPAFERATENMRKKLEATGVKVKVLTKEEAESELARLEELADMQKRTAPETVSVQDEHLQTVVSSAGKRKSPETALPEDESSFKGTAISSDDGAKILKDIDSAIAKYENSNDRAETFIGNVAKALGIDAKDKSSKYATFEAKNGVIFTIRISNHNATVSNFDNAGEGNGISIVISRKPNEGVINDGNAHLVEFFYPEKKISKAAGKPLVEILKSIKQALYSGEYKDNTGLAVREEVNIPEFLRTSDGTTYGWAVNGEIYLTPEGLNPNTPIHEYTHLWAAALQKSNPKLWSEVVEAMKLSPAWNEVMADENYTDIHGDDNRMASEVLSRLSGNEGYRRYMEQAEAEIAAERNIGEKVRKKGALNFFKRIWNKFRNWLQSVFKSGKVKAGDGTEAKAEPWDVFVNKSLKDFDEGMNPDAKDSPLDWMFIGKKGAEMQEGETLFSKKELTPEQKKKQEALKENAKAIRRLHNVTSRYPITALRNLGFALETQEQREMHDRLFAERDAITGESKPAGLQTNPQAMTLLERITESLLKQAEQEKENVEMRLSAIRAYGRDLANVIKLMNAQKVYDRNTVRMFTDLVKMYLRNNAMDGLSSYKIARLLNLMQRATGGHAKTVNRAAVEIAEIITGAHTKQLNDIMEKQIKTGKEKVNASGVVVQGGVDIIGKRILNTYKDAINLDDKGFEEKYNSAFERVGNLQKSIEDAKKAGKDTKSLENQLKEAQAEADAMLLAATYRNEVKAAEADITKIKDELTGKRTKAEKGEITWKEYHEFAKTINSQIVQLRAQQIDAYQKVLHALSGDIYEGVQRARAFREAEAKRVQRIHDMAENDMNGVSKSAERKEPGVVGKTVDMMVYKRWSVRAVMNGMGTYENYMKYFGRDYVDGKGELFNYFMTAFNEAQDKEWKESQNDFNILEAAAQKIFGKKKIGKTYKTIARDSTKPSGVILKYWDGGATVERELTIGQLMYLYMTEKQIEGQMKLRNMGLTEEKVKAAVEQLPTKYKKFADYIQAEFLPQMRPRMNEVHQRMFGASMSEVENYFPLRVNKDARQGNEDINNTSDAIPSTITGSVIKRRVNVTPIDLMANAFDVLNDHVVDMEHWAAFAEFTRDNNTLINDKDFKNRVKNTKSVRYGDGETAWNDFVDTARIVTGNYKARRDYLAKLMSGANAAKITFGSFTALKQIASLPAFLGDANVFDLMWTASTPVGWWSSWNWAIKNLPGFEERWKNRTGGNERLGENEYSIHDSRIMKAARKVGMTPNAFIDAVVVASGARAVYNTRLRFYKSLGLTEYEADKRAKNDAAISYNETQQSGQGAYLSSLQKDSGLVAMLTTLFRNSQMAFQRRVIGSMVGIGKKLARGERIREATKQKYIKMGVDEATAEKQATNEFYKSYAKDFTNLAIFGYGMNYLWVLIGQLPYLLFGDDEEEKEKIYDMAKKVGVTGMFEGFTLGNFAKGLYEKHITDGKYAVGLLEAPFEGDLQKVIDSFEKDGTAAGILQLGIILTEMNTGISPQRLIDLAAAFIDDSDGDVKLANDGVLLGLRILEAPQSQQDMLILDEIYGADAEKVKKVAERYIEYKMNRNLPFGSTDEKRVDKYANKFVETLKERVEKDYNPEDISVIYDQSSDTEKEILKKKWLEEMDKRNGTNVAKSLRKEKLQELLGSPIEKAAAKALHRISKVDPYEKMETYDDLERWYEYKVLLDVFQEDYDKLRKGEEIPPEEREKAGIHYEIYKDKNFKEIVNAISTLKKLIKKNDNPEGRMAEIRRLTDIATEIMKRYE